MIQRIQTVWLFLAALCAALTFKFPFYTGNVATKDNIMAYEQLVASSNFLLLILTAILIAGSLYIIFLYKERKRQLWFTIGAAVVSASDLVIYFTQMKKFTSGNISLTSILSFAIPVLFILAARGIWKDEKLIKSLDRLR